MGWLSLASGLLSGLLKVWEQFGSDTAVLHRWKVNLARKQALQQAEKDRLQAEYDRIAATPDLKGEDLLKRLNELSKRAEKE